MRLPQIGEVGRPIDRLSGVEPVPEQMSVASRAHPRWHAMAPIVVAFGLVGKSGMGFSLLSSGLSTDVAISFARPAIVLGVAAFLSARMADLPRLPAVAVLAGLAGTLLWNTDGGGLFYLAPLAVLLIATRPSHRSTWPSRAVLGLVATGGAIALLAVLPLGRRGVAAIAVAAGAALGTWLADRAEGDASQVETAIPETPQPQRSRGRIGTGIVSGVVGAVAGFVFGWVILLAFAAINALNSEPQFTDLGLAALAIIFWPTVIGGMVGVTLAPAIVRRRARR